MVTWVHILNSMVCVLPNKERPQALQTSFATHGPAAQASPAILLQMQNVSPAQAI